MSENENCYCTSSFTSKDFNEPGFIWYQGYPVAFVKENHALLLLLPFELLRRYPHYSASFNGFIEISSSLLFETSFVIVQLIKTWANRYFGADFKVNNERLKQSVANMFGFHTGFYDLSRRIRYSDFSSFAPFLSQQPLDESFQSTMRMTKALEGGILYEVTPLWSNHVKKPATKESALRLSVTRGQNNARFSIQTSAELNVNHIFLEKHNYDRLLGFYVRKINCSETIQGIWFIPRQRVHYDVFFTQSRCYLTPFEMAKRLTVINSERVKMVDVERQLDAIAWSSDPSLRVDELEEIALLMMAIDYPKDSLTRHSSIFYELIVNDVPLEKIIQRVEAFTEGRHTVGNINSDALRSLCMANAVEFIGPGVKQPIARYYAENALRCHGF